MDSVGTKSLHMFVILHRYSHLSLSSQICANLALYLKSGNDLIVSNININQC